MFYKGQGLFVMSTALKLVVLILLLLFLIDIQNIGGEQVIGVGTPGREYSKGGVYYYSSLSSMTTAPNGVKAPIYSPTDDPPTPNTENQEYVYNGLFVTSGNFTGSEGCADIFVPLAFCFQCSVGACIATGMHSFVSYNFLCIQSM